MPENLSELSARKGLENNLFENLVEDAKKTGTPSRKKLQEQAKEFLIGDAITLGTASFYDFLKEENAGKKVFICSGTACLCAGTQDKLKDDLKKSFKDEEIGHMACLGRCHENTAFNYDGKNFSGASLDIELIKAGDKKAAEDSYAVESNCEKPILTAPFTNIADYYNPFIKAISKGNDALLAEIKESALRGRGGAGFPIGLKLESCKNTEGEQKYIVCNADEGDPGAYSDRYLMEERPHSVLLGMMIAGFVVGADTGVLYIRAEYPESIDIIKAAIEDIRKAGFLGDDIKGSGFNYKFKVIQAAGAYICGEETALLNSIEGQRPEVRVRPPYPTQEGLFNKPTIVNNVETLASLPFIVEHGGAAYKKYGTERSTGTKLVSIDSFFNRPGIYEVTMGTPLRDVFEKLAGGLKSDVKAFHIGGPLGGLVPKEKVNDINVDFESFSQNGFLMGHASVVSVPNNFPIVEYIKHLFEFTKDESCGKCFPCRLGSQRGYELFDKAINENYKIENELLDDLLETMEIGSLCALGGGLPLPIKNALEYFKDELEQYLTLGVK
jgi:NADH-quinone oxidoreductase subunit F